MSRPFALPPAIVWVLDDAMQRRVESWHDSLDPRTKAFIKVAVTPAEVRLHFHDFRQERFDQILAECGLSLEPHHQGRKITMVMAASVARAQGSTPWEWIQYTTDEIRSEAFSLEAHYLLVAEGPTADGLKEHLADLEAVPWLLTDKTAGGYQTESPKISLRCAQLLDALVLAEREGINHGESARHAFYYPCYNTGQVRLVGFPRLDLQKLVEKMTGSLALAILRHKFPQDSNRKDPPPQAIKEVYEELDQRLNQFLKSGLTSSQVIDWLVGASGLGTCTITEIVQHGKSILEKKISRLQKEQIFYPQNPTPEVGRSRGLISLIRRLFNRENGQRLASRPSKEQLEYLIKALSRIRKIIQGLAALAKKSGDCSANLPEGLMYLGNQILDELTRYALRNIWGKPDIMGRLGQRLEKEVADHFHDAIHHWKLQDSMAQEVARGFDNGDLLRFSARLQDDSAIPAAGLVTSLQFGDHLQYGSEVIPCATLRLWPGRPPLLLAGSKPLHVKDLQL